MAIELNQTLQAFQSFASGAGGDDAVANYSINSAPGNGTTEAVKVDGHCATWHDRTWKSGSEAVKDSIDRNNLTRQAFLDALIDQFGTGNKKGFSCLPAYIRQALKGTWSFFTESGDFGLKADDSAESGVKVTGGKPLTARRINAVFAAIEREEMRRVNDERQIQSGQVSKVDKDEEPVDFKSKFTTHFMNYDFGTPLVGVEGTYKDAEHILPTVDDKKYPIRRLMLHMLNLQFDNCVSGFSEESRRIEEFYKKISDNVFDLQPGTNIGVIGYASDAYQGDAREALHKVFYDFVVDFNMKNPGFEITIPQDEIDKYGVKEG